jgi:outer membrane receptor protein involved in Fe transport
VKAELLDGRLTASMAYFAITKSGILQTVGLTPYQTPIGEIESNGFEVDIAGRIDDNWSLIGNYSHDTVRITKDANVNNIGHRLVNAPLDSGNIWVKYDADGEFKGLSLGGGLNVVGERQGDNANTFQLPAYASANAMIAYSFQPPELPWTKNVTVQLNVKNLFDSVYYVNSQSRGIIMPGTPRTFSRRSARSSERRRFVAPFGAAKLICRTDCAIDAAGNADIGSARARARRAPPPHAKASADHREWCARSRSCRRRPSRRSLPPARSR